ncbi:MAG TPA: GlsB/YeaQ/YmgE family stress response membrane protein [Candidatus Saccharimonadales bacterium]|nr:GlsB/YeaQ/YmgE family stress response membrane protein [Candidatus Saccharimonadales bacterium]
MKTIVGRAPDLAADESYDAGDFEQAALSRAKMISERKDKRIRKVINAPLRVSDFFWRASVSRTVDIRQGGVYKVAKQGLYPKPHKRRQEEMMGLIYSLIVGLIAGWLAGQVMKGGGYGVLVDILLGLLGGVIGGFVLGLIGLHAGGLIGEIVVSFIGAVILVWISRQLKKA